MNRDNLKCSFCGKSQDQVAKLVAGPRVFICDECTAIVVHIMNEDGTSQQPPQTPPRRGLLSVLKGLLQGCRPLHSRRSRGRSEYHLPVIP
jgi:hypothetical protein